MRLRVRAANSDDKLLSYRWANDPLVRAMSANDGMVPLDTFTRTFVLLLHDPSTLFLIVEGFEGDAWHPVAQVRFADDGTISMLLDSGYRGRRLATPVLLAALEFAKEKFHATTIVAHILYENVSSIKAFERAGFTFNREVACKGQPCVEYVYDLR